MKVKRTFYTEIAYIAGLFILALGTALMVKSDFGVSMIVAPAYLLHLKLQQYWAWFTFGMAEYLFQAFLLIVLSAVMRRGKISYLFSFITAVLYGLMLDLITLFTDLLPGDSLPARHVFYCVGLLFCTAGVALLFHTYIAPEAYELVVKEISSKYGFPIHKVKIVYDFCSFLLGVILSFLFFGFGHFEGVKIGTVVCTAVNGWLIGRMSRMFESVFTFRDALRLRSVFDK